MFGKYTHRVRNLLHRLNQLLCSHVYSEVNQHDFWNYGVNKRLIRTFRVRSYQCDKCGDLQARIKCTGYEYNGTRE